MMMSDLNLYDAVVQMEIKEFYWCDALLLSTCEHCSQQEALYDNHLQVELILIKIPRTFWIGWIWLFCCYWITNNESLQMTMWNLDQASQHLSGQNDPNTPIIISTLPTIVFTQTHKWLESDY